MIEKTLVMISYGSYYGGGMIEDVLDRWAEAGLFAYVLPFLLIFAVVFGILDRMNVFDRNKAINALIALSVGLMSIQFDLVPWFFSEVFPRFGIGLIVILISLIFLGLYLDPDRNHTTTILIISAVVGIAVFAYTADVMGFSVSSYDLWDNLPTIIMGVIILVILFSMINSGKDDYNSTKTEDRSILGQLLRDGGNRR